LDDDEAIPTPDDILRPELGPSQLGANPETPNSFRNPARCSFAVPWAFASVTSEPLLPLVGGPGRRGVRDLPRDPLQRADRIQHVGWVTIVDLPRRASFLQNELICSGVTCAPGAEPMMGPAR
jgi:hypothetical protein